MNKLTVEGWVSAERSTRQGRRYRTATNLGARHGAPWNAKESADLLAAHDAGKPLAWLAARHGRTVNAMGVQLDRLNLLQAAPPACPPIVATRATGVGSRHTGQHQGLADTNAGIYWEAMYRPGEDELRIQTALLAPAAQARATVKRWWMRPLCAVGLHWRGVSGLGMYGDAARCSICGADSYHTVVLFEDK